MRFGVRDDYQPAELAAVISDGLDRTAFHGFFALGFLFGRGRLLEDVGIAAVVITGKIIGGGFAAQITVDALVIDVVLA